MSGRTFVSYARADRDFAHRLGRDLRAAGVNIWVDQLDIKPGELWDQAVEKALAASAAVIVVLTPNAVDSRSVMDEVSYALETEKRVLPVVAERCDIPLRIRRLQHTDFTSDYASGLARIVQTLAPGLETGPPPPPVLAPRRLMAAVWAGGASAVLQYLFFHQISQSSQSGLGMIVAQILDSGALLSGVLWAIAGAICGMRRQPVTWALITAVAGLILSRYFTTLPAALAIGAPLGAIVGATLNRLITRKRRSYALAGSRRV